jgi:adenosylcobinamide kinase/adenosylcobinamide-phosphate guanylyltransferase
VTVVATALPSDEEMADRIRRHRQDRPAGFETVDCAVSNQAQPLGACLRALAGPDRLLLVDCLTLWASQVLMPHPVPDVDVVDQDWPSLLSDLLSALTHCRDVGCRVVLISNEIGWGVVPLGREVRQVVDELGRLNQVVAARCDALTLMVAGQPWTRPVEVRS